MPETKRRLLDATVGLMLRQGFTATTVDQICAGAGLTKGSFFHYFESKEAIGEAVLDHYYARQQEKLAAAGLNEVSDPLERLHTLLEFLGASVRDTAEVQGCLMGNLAQELAVTHPRIRSRCDEKFSNFARWIQELLTQAKAKRCPRAVFDPAGVALLFVSLMQGSLLLAKARQDKALLGENLDHFRRYVDSLFVKPAR